jgi:hypothetical protein
MDVEKAQVIFLLPLHLIPSQAALPPAQIPPNKQTRNTPQADTKADQLHGRHHYNLPLCCPTHTGSSCTQCSAADTIS